MRFFRRFLKRMYDFDAVLRLMRCVVGEAAKCWFRKAVRW